MKTYGFVYILENRCMPGMWKIGMTMRSPTARAEELSRSTGVPEPFTVIYFAEVEDPAAVEAMLHLRFSEYRVSGNREFFTVEPAVVADELYEYALSCWMDSPVAIALRNKNMMSALSAQPGGVLQ